MSRILDGRGRLLGVVVVFRDVSEARAREEQLRRNERLASLGTLSAGIAHEVNSPLAAVLINAETLRTSLESIGAFLDSASAGKQHEEPVRAAKEELAFAREALIDTKAGAVRASKVIDAVRRFARGEVLERSVHRPEDLVQETLTLMRAVVTHQARLEVRAGAAPEVVADEGEIVQVLSNLLTNAAFAVAKRERDALIVVSTSTDPQGRAVIAVTDNGTGIDPEILPRVLDPFFTTKPIGVGSGLGLSISHGIVKALGGELSIQSTPGEGTTVRVVLPPARGG